MVRAIVGTLVLIGKGRS
ncbi:hypothetical protein [Pedobacter sp. UC225_65]